MWVERNGFDLIVAGFAIVATNIWYAGWSFVMDLGIYMQCLCGLPVDANQLLWEQIWAFPLFHAWYY